MGAASRSFFTAGRIRQWLLNVASGYADLAVGGVIFVLLTPLLVRYLGVEGYAIWVVSHTITFYLHFLDLGFGSAQVRFHAQLAAQGEQQDIARLTRTTAISLLVSGVIATVLGLALAAGPASWWIDTSPALEADFRTVLLLLVINLMVAFPASVLDNLYDGLQRFDIQNARSIVLRIVTAGAQVTLLLQGYGLVELAALELAMSCVLVVVDSVILNRLMPGLLRLPLVFDTEMWRRMRSFALWDSLDDLLVEGTPKLNNLLIAVILPLALLTPYSLCATAAGVLALAVFPVTTTLLPLAAGLHAHNRLDELANVVKLGSKVAAAIAAPLAIFLIFFGEAALRLWIPDMQDEVPALLLTVITLDVLVSVYLMTSAIVLTAMNAVRTVVILTAIEIVLTLGFVLALAPAYGLLGVVIGSLAGNVLIGFGLQVPIVARRIGVSVPQLVVPTLGRVALAVTPAALVAYQLRISFDASGWLELIGAAATIGLVSIAGLYFVGTSRSERARCVALWREMESS
jgi:O-antigen/teichoic acid export membrane protein